MKINIKKLKKSERSPVKLKSRAMNEDNLSGTECTEVLSAQEPIIQLTEHGVEGFDMLCRLCANRAEHLISIYSDEGVTNDLADKMNLYLPIKINKSDVLPLQCCYQCASTVLTWHELVIASVEADRRLRDIQSEVEKQLAQQNSEPGPSQIEEEKSTESEDERPADTNATSLNPFRQEHVQDEIKPEPVDEPVVKKRGRPAGKTKRPVKFETVNTDMTTDGEWIKTELVLETEGVQTFIENCEITEEDPMKLSPPASVSDNTDFDDLDPEFDPGEFTKTKTHICPTCDKAFRKITELRKHMQTCNGEIKDDLLAENDGNSLDDEFSIDMPKKRIERKNNQEYLCDYCEMILQRRDDLRKHVQEIHPEHLEAFKKKRGKTSKLDQDAVARAKIVVDSRTYYHCNECGKNLHSPYTYIWHNRIHTGERPFICDLCGKQFRVSQGLLRHLRETHAGIKNFPCDLCGRMFATRRNVEEHRRIHTNERPYICDLCGKAFKQKASLFVHNRSHTDNFPFKCSYCNQGFRTRPPLLIHVTRHTGEKPYACDICGRCFRIKYELKRHRLIHSDDKPFSCTDCGVSFRQKRYLRNHNKINHNLPTP